MPRTLGGSIKFIFVLTLLFAPVAGAQNSPDSSPVAVVKTSSYVPTCQYGYDKCFSVTYRNDSDKEIVAVKFDVVFVDKIGDKHTYGHSFLIERHGGPMERSIKPGKTSQAVWDNLLYDYCREYEVTVVKVAFKDGTVWEAKSQ